MTKTPMVIVPDLGKLGLEETKASEIKALFDPMLKKMATYEKEYNKIVNADINEKTAEAARVLRLKYVKVRTGTVKIHKEAKAYHLAAGRALDGFLNAQKFAGAEIEEKLSEIENYEAAKKQAEIDKKTTDRRWKMGEFGMSTALMPPNIGEWEDDLWEEYIAAVEAKWKRDQEEALQARKKAAAAAPHAGDGSPHPHELTGEAAGFSASIDLETGEMTPLDDKSAALQLILDLNDLTNKYVFQDERYKFAYQKMGERFAKDAGLFTNAKQDAMIKLHMVGGRTLEVMDNHISVSLAINSSKNFKSFTELIPSHSKGEEHNTRKIRVNINNILYVSYE